MDWKLFFSIIAIVVVGPFLYWSLSNDPPSRSTSEAELERIAARRMCREAIEAVLHDPRSAQWEPTSSWAAGPLRGDDSTFLVQTNMRARNAFGAMVQTQFECTFQCRGGAMRLVELKDY
jgi:hypothetical protein